MAVLQSNYYQTQANIQYSLAQRALNNSGDTAAAKNYNRKGDFYQTQANIQYSLAQRALNSGDTAAAKNYNRKGDYYQQLVYVHQQKEAAAAAAAQEAAERAKWENIQGYGDTAASKEYLAQKAAAAALAKTESDRAALMYLGTGVTDVQTMNSSIATQSAVAAATLAVNNAQAPDPGAAGTVSQLALQTQAQDYIDSAPPGPQLQDVINAQNGGPMQPDYTQLATVPDSAMQQTIARALGVQVSELPGLARRYGVPINKLDDILLNEDGTRRAAPRSQGINLIFIGVGIAGAALIARAVMR